MTVVLLVVLYLIVALVELPPFIHNGEYKELMVYGALFFGAFLLSILLGLGVNIPSPVTHIEYAIKMFKGMFGGGL